MPMIQGRHLCRHREPVKGFASSSASSHYPPDIELEPRHLAIDLQISIDERSARGAVTTTVKARRSGPRSVTFHAVDFESVDVRDPDGNDLEFEYDGEELSVRWSEPFADGEERRVETSYEVVEPVAGLYFSAPDEDYPDLPRWAATDHETERARHWLPCIDLPQVRTTLEFALRADAGFTILANGASQGEEEHDDGTKTARWKLDFPCPSYLVCFVLGELVEYDDGAYEDRPLRYYGVAPHTSEDLARSFDRTGRIMAWMTDRLDRPFPFPKYFQFAVPGIGGAMENISLVSWEGDYVLVEELEPEWAWLVDQVNVHEMAHSWFGDSVVCREFAHAWLKESWATYMETCWLEHAYGAEEQLYDLWRNATAYFDEADNAYSRPIVAREYDASFDLYDRHLYPGGACRLHTLRHLLGDETFWEGVHLYLDRFEGETVETDDFRKVMEEVSGRSLVRFFEQWFLRAGYPDLEVTWSWDSDEGEAVWTVTQTQVDEKGEGPLFRDLELELGWRAGSATEYRTVKLDERKQSFAVKLEAKPDIVRFDARGKTLHKLEFNPGDALLRTQLDEADDVLGPIQAAWALAKTGKRRNIEAIAEAWSQDRFWGVRRELAAALASTRTEQAFQALLRIAEEESDPMVLDHLILQLRAFGDARAVDVLKTRIEEGLVPLARRAALMTIGRLGKESVVDYLDAQARTAENLWVREGALQGLGETRSRKAYEPLKRHLTYGNDVHNVRKAAARALGNLVPYLAEHERGELVEELKRVLRDPVARVAMGAARGLGAARASEATEELEAFARSRTAQEGVDVKRIVRGIRKSTDPKVKSLEEEVDALRGLITRLEDRVRTLEK